MLAISDRKTVGLSVPTTPADGLDAYGRPCPAAAEYFPREDLLLLKCDDDSHCVAYSCPPFTTACRLRKEALGPLLAAGHRVECDVVVLDLDLQDCGHPPKTTWATVSDPDWVRADLRARVERLRPAVVYGTRAGLRAVHYLRTPITAGAGFEALLASYVERYHAAGVPVDRSCRDWTRMFRMPRVTREPEGRTWEQPYYFEDRHEDRLDPVPGEFSGMDPLGPSPSSPQERRPVRVSDDEALALLYSDPASGALTEVASRVSRSLRQSSEDWEYVFGSRVLATERRHDALLRLVGFLAKYVRRFQGMTPELLYAMAWEAARKMPQDGHDFRAECAEMVATFWARDGQAVPAEPASSAAQAPPADDLESDDGLESGELTRDDDGKPYVTRRNLRVACRLLDLRLSYDEFWDRRIAESRSSPGGGWRKFPRTLSDDVVLDVMVRCEEGMGLKVSREYVADTVRSMCSRARFHPVRDYLKKLEWDGRPRADSWMSAYLGAEPTPFVSAVGRLLLVAGVRRVRVPGDKFDEIVLLEGEQGTRKSTALQALFKRPEWFSDSLPLGVDDQQVLERTLGKWGIEVPELSGMSEGKIENMKAFLSRTTDRARMSYERELTERPRQWVPVGTTNSDHYLEDSTGNRRFWPVRVGKILVDDLARDVDQLWAEAVLLEKDVPVGGVRLDPSLYQAAAEEQEARRVADPHEEFLQSVVGTRTGRLRVLEVYDVLGMPTERRGLREGRRVAAVMQRLGWKKKYCRWADGSVLLCFEKVPADGSVQFWSLTRVGKSSAQAREVTANKKVTA